MSKKKLLEESTVRSFMKLANLQPLSDKFIKEGYGSKEEELNEEEHEGEKGSKKSEKSPASKDETMKEEMETEGDGQIPFGKDDERDAHSDVTMQEEVVAEVEDTNKKDDQELHEGDADGLKPLKAKMGTGGKPVQSHQGNTEATPASVSAPNRGPTTKKMRGVDGMKKIKGSQDAKWTTLKMNTKDISFGQPVPMNESLEEEEMGPPPEGEAPTPSDEAGESAEHQETVKGALQKMLAAMQDIAKEYGVDMAVDAGGEMEEPEGGEMEEPEGETPEAPPPAGEEEGKMMQETLDILTKRVAARLLKRK